MNLFNIKRGSLIHIPKVLSDATLIILERIIYLATILLLVQYRFHNDCFMVSILQNYGKQIKVNRQQAYINVYVSFFAITAVHENI